MRLAKSSWYRPIFGIISRFLSPPRWRRHPATCEQDFFRFLRKSPATWLFWWNVSSILRRSFDDGLLLESVEVCLHFADHAFDPPSSSSNDSSRSFSMPINSWSNGGDLVLQFLEGHGTGLALHLEGQGRIADGLKGRR